MKYAYSSSKNLFYVIDWQDGYGDSWPSDAVEVSKAVFDEFSASAPEGQVRCVSGDGLPEWGNIPPMTPEALIAFAITQREMLLEKARETIGLWQTELQLGMISDDDRQHLIAWLRYIRQLNEMDVKTVTDGQWPTEPK